VASRRQALADKHARLAGEVHRLQSEASDASAAGGRTRLQLAEAEGHRADCEAALAAADDAQRAADAARHAWVARAEALTLALDEARARAGAERLAGVAGVVGTLLEVVAVEPGFEAAFEAAAGEAVAAVVVADASSGRRALDVLHAAAAAGAVLPVASGPHPSPMVPPAGVGLAMRSLVRGAAPGVDALLDRLVGGTVVVDDWPAAIDAALAAPAAVIVTRAGDRFGPSGWRVGSTGAGATGAALDEARGRSAEAEEVALAAADGARLARLALDTARHREVDLARAVDQHEARGQAASDAVRRVEADGSDAQDESASLAAHLADLSERLRPRAGPPGPARGAAADPRGRGAARGREGTSPRRGAFSTSRSGRLPSEPSGATSRSAAPGSTSAASSSVAARPRSTSAWPQHAAERDEAEARRLELDRRALATDRLIVVVDRSVAEVEGAVADLRERRRRQSEAALAVASRLDGLRRQRAEAKRR